VPADPRALAPQRAPAGTGGDPVRAAQRGLDATLAEIAALDAEVEALSHALAAFAEALERRLAGPDLAARRAGRLVRQLQALAEGLAAEARGLAERPARTRSGRRRAGTPRGKSRPGPRPGADRWSDEPDDGVPDDEAGGASPDAGPEGLAGEAPLESAAAELKRLYRRLARLLHPDLAPDDAERARLSDLMARANAAYEADDLATLSVMAERLGAGDPPGDLTPGERLASLVRRLEQLSRVAASLRRERAQLLATETARLHGEAERRRAAGGDYLAESEAELAEEAAAARADALARLAAVARAAQALGSERRKVMSELARRGGGGLRRGFDPLAESALVRRSAARLERARATAPARALARWLEEAAARPSPWEAGLTLLAFLLEAAGDRPPPAVATVEGLEARWEVLRAAWTGAPGLAEALAERPAHLMIGARAGREAVVAGLQLASAELAAGVRIALGQGAVAGLARQVLGALGPEERCPRCRRQVRALHLLRTRGLDERHGLACPRCGRVLKSWWRYGEVEGLEAVWPLSLAAGLVAEVPVRLGGATLGFGLAPVARDRLTARGLLALVEELYLDPCQVALPRRTLRLVARGKPLAPAARVGALASLALRLEPGAGTTAVALLELLRTRVARRFKPGAE